MLLQNKMIVLLGLVAFFAASACAQTRCCQPDDQFTVKKRTIVGEVSTWPLRRLADGQTGVIEFFDYAVDYTNRRIAAVVARHLLLDETVFQTVRLVEDLQLDVGWVIYPDVQKCILKRPYQLPPYWRPERRCIPDEAVFLKADVIGSGNNTVNSYEWIYERTGPTGFNETRVIAVDDNCVPLGEDYFGTGPAFNNIGNQQLVASATYVNYTVGISEEYQNFFKIPNYCKGPKLEEEQVEEPINLKWTP